MADTKQEHDADTTKPPGDDRFFHRTHYISTGWSVVGAILVAILTFATSETYHRVVGPETVVILDPDTTARYIPADTLSRAYLRQLVEEMRASRQPQTTPPVQRTARTPLSLPTPGASSDTTDLDQPPAPHASELGEPNAPQVPAFRFPGTSKGWTSGQLAVFAQARCPPPSVRSGTTMDASFQLRNSSLLPKMTPVVVRMYRMAGSRFVGSVLDQQYELHPRNLLRLPVPTQPGEYRLDFGIYLIPDLGEQYPRYYSQACRFVVGD